MRDKRKTEKKQRTSPDIVIHHENVVENGGKGPDVGERTSVGTNEGSLSRATRETGVGESDAERLEEAEEVGRVLGRDDVAVGALRSGVLPAIAREVSSVTLPRMQTSKTHQSISTPSTLYLATIAAMFLTNLARFAAVATAVEK